MKNLYLFSVFTILIFSCKEELTPPIEEETDGTLKINFIGKHGSDDFVLYSDDQNLDNQAYRVENLKFYISNLNVGSNSPSDVFFLDFANNHTTAGSTGESISIELPSGDYNNFEFLVGLDSLTNHGDPSLYGEGHPLSSFNSMHWDWAQGYKFLLIDGKIDSDSDNVPEQLFAYHIGNDDYKREVSLSTPISISAGATTELNIYVNVKDFFVDVDMINDNFTHSTDNFDLVEKIADNYSNAFSLIP